MHFNWKRISTFWISSTKFNGIPDRGLTSHEFDFHCKTFRTLRHGNTFVCIICWAYLSIYYGHMQTGCFFSCHIYLLFLSLDSLVWHAIFFFIKIFVCVQWTLNTEYEHCSFHTIALMHNHYHFCGLHSDFKSLVTHIFFYFTQNHL